MQLNAQPTLSTGKRDESPSFKWIIWSLAALFYFYEFLLRVSPSVMVPKLMASFNITASSVGVLSAYYLYAYAPMQLPVGLLMDRYGLKRILSIASIVCGLGALLFACADQLLIAGIGRLLIGGSSAFAFIAIVYVTSHWFSPRKRASLIGIANSVAMIGASAGVGPLSIAIDRSGWRFTIALFGLFGLFLGVAVYLVLKNNRYSLSTQKQSSTGNANIFTQFKSIVYQKRIWLNALVALFFYMTTTAFAGLWGLSFVQTAYGLNKEVAGYAMSMVFIGWVIGGPLSGWLSDRLGKRVPVIRWGILGTLFCLIPVIYFPILPIYCLYGLLLLIGTFSSAELLNFTLAIELNHPAVKATTAAFTNFVISCGDSLVQPLVGFLLDHSWSGALENGLRIYTAQNYQVALSCLPVALAVAFLLLFFVQEKH
jgi:MFS family permease